MQYRVSFAEGAVYRGTSAVTLSRRELELVLYLASRSRACSGDEIVEALWPQRCKSDKTILRVTVLRARTRLGDPAAIIASNGWYRLRDDVCVDLRDLEGLVSFVKLPLDAAMRGRIKTAVESLTEEPAILASHDCFAPIALRIAELRHCLAMTLAQDALNRRDSEAALEILALLVAFDPYDEPARELRIHAYLTSGDRAAALREYRVYRDLLAAHLGVEPSIALEDVLESA